jgi:hypothetical protein
MKFDASLHRCTIIINKNLPIGLAMNAASVIGISFGCTVENLVGLDLQSQDDVNYPGVIYSPLPILTASHDYIHELLEITKQEKDIYHMPFSALAQSCKTYDEKISSVRSQDIELVAIGLIGPKKKINKITGSLPLYK